MEEAQIITVVQDAVMTIFWVSLPMLGLGLATGLIISILQATTQINEQTLVFVVKIVSVFGAHILFGPWMLQRLTDFTNRLYAYILVILRQ